MLKPQANATRELVSLDGIWQFALASSGDIDGEAAWKTVIPPTLQVPVPASYNDIFVDQKIHDHIGWVYYQREATLPRGWAGGRYFLRLDAATHQGRVYINDTFVVEHIGGYMPFEADITNLVAPGEQFRLTVAVNNELSYQTIPPGWIETLEGGLRKQHYQHDFFNYAGLARSVWLYCVPTVAVSGVSVVTDVVDGTKGVVNFEIETSGPVRDDALHVSLVDEAGQVVGQATGAKNRIEVESVNLWQPGAAYLYQLRTEIRSEEGKVLDVYQLAVGVRTVKVVGNKFLINDKPFYFTGFGKHEDTPVRGKGYDPAYMVHDFHLMRWMGANSFRTSHYPYAEEVLEYADRHGIVVINETPAVGLNLAIVAGFFRWKDTATFSPKTMNDQTQAALESAVRELFARDRNHPSVVMWTLMNEPAAHEEGAREFFEPVVRLARELDPTRPLCYANEVQASTEADRLSDLFDVLCLNRYYGWYIHCGNLELAEQLLEKELRAWQAKYDKPIIMTEYGADTQAGVHAVFDVPWSEEYQTNMIEMSNRVFDRIDGVVGEHVWNFADFQCPPNTFRVDGNKKGVFTRDRRPKAAVQALKRRWLAMAQSPKGN